MATVSSLTKEKIQELVAGWEDVSLSQDQINALVAQLWTSQATLDAMMETFNNVTLPDLQADVSQASIQVSDLNGTTLPDLQAKLDQNELQIQNLNTVDIPALQANLASEIENTAVRPQVFVQPEAPPQFDEDTERELVVGDTWHDSDDNNRVRIWNGVEWSTFNVDVADFSLTVRSFLSTSHMIY